MYFSCPPLYYWPETLTHKLLTHSPILGSTKKSTYKIREPNNAINNIKAIEDEGTNLEAVNRALQRVLPSWEFVNTIIKHDKIDRNSSFSTS